MEEIIKIKCPFDGAVLSVKNQPGIETKNVTCPICHNKYPFTKFKRVTEEEFPIISRTWQDSEEKTSYAIGKEESSGRHSMNDTIGNIRVMHDGSTYQLKEGKNVIGRKASKSTADFQVETGDGRSMSREHIVIEVKDVPGKGMVHYISLFKPVVNPTFIGEEPLLYGDCVILENGDLIRMPDAELKFEIPDPEATVF